MTVRVFLLDDHEIVRRGLREVFEAEADIEVVGEASNAAEAMARVHRPGPMWPCSTYAYRTGAVSKYVVTCGRPGPS